MLRCLTRFAAGCAMLAVFSSGSIAQAQLFGGGCNNCAPPPECCQVMQPVAQSCYQSVPVTEYQPVKQIVRRPRVEQRMVSQDVVEYQPVNEQRVADVPFTTYQDVTEYQQVCRNAGYWQTNVQQNCKVSPCEYDNRQGFLGWMNRTAYGVRSSFTPAQTVSRQFVPQTVMQTVPVTRRVAVQGTRQVTYNVQKMVANRTTRQVAVNHVTYEDVETTAMMPRTVMRQVPIGTQMSYAPFGYGSASALAPTPDYSTSVNRPLESREALNRPKDTFRPETDPNNYKNDVPIKAKGAALERPTPRDSVAPPANGPVTKSPEARPLVKRTSPPSMVRLNQWVARTPKLPAGPASDISLADVDR